MRRFDRPQIFRGSCRNQDKPKRFRGSLLFRAIQAFGDFVPDLCVLEEHNIMICRELVASEGKLRQWEEKDRKIWSLSDLEPLLEDHLVPHARIFRV
eukprot:s288_g26.t1